MRREFDSRIPLPSQLRKPYFRVVLGILAVLIGLPTVQVPSVSAATTATVLTYSAVDAANGVTATSSDKTFSVGFAPGVLTGASTVTLTPAASLPIALTSRYRAATSAWTVTVDPPPVQPVPVTLTVADPNLYRKLLLTPTPGRTGWDRVPGAQWTGTAFTATATVPITVLGVDDTKVLQGIASWYRTSRYPAGVASNDFPMGTKLKVTNLANGKATIVTVVSTGPFVRGRVVDLSYTAFLKIATGGLARVQVERATAPVVALSVVGEPKPDTDAPGTPTPKSSAATTRPAVTSPSAFVVDQGSAVELYSKNADTVRPIASLTKLVSVSVFLDTNPDLNKVVAFASADRADCSCLNIVPGETARLKDFLGTALVGSANNATKTLARSSGLDFPTFVARMNSLAASWGAKTAHFHEPTGLDPANVASARDITRILEGAMRDHPLVRDLLLKQSYVFQTVSSGVLHTIKTTNPLIVTSPLAITGGKTGYLDEALYTYVLRARDSAGHQVIAVILGAPTSSVRFTEAERLLTWALANHTWSG